MRAQTDAVVADGKLIVDSSRDFSYTGYMRNRASGTGGLLLFEKRGTGTQTLVGSVLTFTGDTTISGGTLQLRDAAAWASRIINNSVLVLEETTTRTHNRDIIGTGSLIKQGTGSLTLAGGLNMSYQGSTTVEGGSLTVASPLSGSTVLRVLNSGSSLAIPGGITNAAAVTTVVVENGATLSLLDGAGNKLSGLTTLQLGSFGGTNTTLSLNAGDGNTEGDNLNTDLLTLLSGGKLSLFAGNKVTFNLTDTGLNAGRTYTLLNVINGGLLSGPLARLTMCSERSPADSRRSR
ncbi:MAG: autotransporter-associated beta strand repeat-containing protein [Pirellulales bacterium]